MKKTLFFVVLLIIFNFCLNSVLFKLTDSEMHCVGGEFVGNSILVVKYRLFTPSRKDLGKVIWKELRVSIMIGLSLALANFLKLILIDKMLFHNNAITYQVAIVICLTIFMIIVVAKLIGCTLPILTKKLGFDPTVMASPFITTIVDALGLIVYFQIATHMLGL